MKDLNNKIRWYFKHKREKKRALIALKKIESVKGTTNPKLIKLSNEYAKNVLGSKVYAPWLYVYSAMQNEFKEGWIPDNYYKKEVVPKLKGDYVPLADRNFITPKLFPNIETLNLAYFINRKFIANDNTVIEPDNIKNYLFNSNDKIVYKLENSQSGKGIHIFSKEDFNVFQFMSLKTSNGVFQIFIEQHSFFSQFTDNSVTTIRITTVSDNNGEISVRAAYARIARDHETHVKSSSAISVSIDLMSGKLHRTGYMNWVETSEHPDTKVCFYDKEIPYFEKLKTVALNLHSKIPFMSCVGWDLTIDKNNKVQLIEWNGKNNDIKFSEATTGPCFINLGWENLWKEINN